MKCTHKMSIRNIVFICCFFASLRIAQATSFLEDFNSIPPGPLAQRTVGPITITFATGTYLGSGFSVLDPFVSHHSQLEPSRLSSNLDILLSFDRPLQEFSILDDPATNEPGANRINVIALASDFSVLAQGAFLNDQLPQSRVTINVTDIRMIVLDFVPLPGIADDEGFDNMILTPIPEPSSLMLAAFGLCGLGLSCIRCRGRQATYMQ